MDHVAAHIMMVNQVHLRLTHTDMCVLFFGGAWMLCGQTDTPVWLQLLQHCGRFSECQLLMIYSMGQQLVQQQQQIAMLQQHQQQQWQQQQHQLAALQEQLARAQAAAETGELLRRLQALEEHALKPQQ